MTAGRMAPLAEFCGQGAVFLAQVSGLEILQSLMHQIEGVVDQLGGLFGGHGRESGGKEPGVSGL